MGKFPLTLDGPLLNIPVSIKSASFDYVGRYQLIAEIITRYCAFTGTHPNRVLDVGGLGSFMEQIISVPVTILDSEVQETSETQSIGNGSHMDSIKDGSYDVVVTSDTLEHIPPQDRRDFIREIIRVSNDLVILCAPFGDHGAAKEEAKINELYKSLTGRKHLWLAEHKQYGLPREEEILSYVPKPIKATVLHHSSLDIWGHLMAINLIANEINEPNIHKTIEKINRDYNEGYLFKDFNEASYRTFIIMSKKHEVVFTKPSAMVSQDDFIKLDSRVIDFYLEILKNIKLLPVVVNILEDLASTEQENVKLKSNNGLLLKQYNRVVTSKSWKLTAPARSVVGTMKRRK